MPSLASCLKWITPHGIVRRFARAREKRAVLEQSERQRALFAQFVPAGSVVFDIGANVGNRIGAFLNCHARVVAVEPQPDCVARLQSENGDRVTIIEAAAGNAAGRMTLHISGPLDSVASLSEEFISKAGESSRFGDRDWGHTIMVEVITLDSLVSQYGLPSFIKIDVEGFELDVLRGLSQAVNVLSFEWTSDSPGSATKCIDYLVGLGVAFFQFSFGETMVFANSRSMNAAAAKSLIAQLGEEPSLFGDIYASRSELLRVPS